MPGVDVLRLEAWLIRWRAWWYNKVPLSITLVLLLLDGRSFTFAAAAVLSLVVLTVSAVGNYGYALNELYDVEEDARAKRANAAAALGRSRMTTIIFISSAAAVALAGAVAGLSGMALTIGAMGVTLLYSRPPWRIKERKWLGVVADALSAHVFPAALALIAVVHWDLRAPGLPLAAGILAWSAAAGLRGILSHQLHTADRDRDGGLTTVVHDFGAPRLERFIIFVLLPIEVGGFVLGMASCDVGWPLWTFSALYLAHEIYRTTAGGFVVTALRPQGQPYVPFLEESYYKAWGPLFIAVDAARIDPVFLAALPLYWFLFRPHLVRETAKLCAVLHRIAASRRGIG